LAKTQFQRFWILIPFGIVLLAKSIWDGWSIYSQSEGLALRRYFRWTVVPWDQTNSVETRSHYGRGQHRESHINHERSFLTPGNGRISVCSCAS
jgi:hypothetical protein